METAEPIEALYCSSEEDPETAPPRLHHLPLEIDRQRPSSPECVPMLTSWLCMRLPSHLRLTAELLGCSHFAQAKANSLETRPAIDAQYLLPALRCSSCMMGS